MSIVVSVPNLAIGFSAYGSCKDFLVENQVAYSLMAWLKIVTCCSDALVTTASPQLCFLRFFTSANNNANKFWSDANFSFHGALAHWLLQLLPDPMTGSLPLTLTDCALLQLLADPVTGSLHPVGSMLAGACSGVLSSLVTMPADVVRRYVGH